MKKVDLPHYGLYGMHSTGANGLFDFLRSDEAIEARKIKKQSRLDYSIDAGQARRDSRLERGDVRREKRLVKSENRLDNTINGGGFVNNLISSLFNKPQEPVYVNTSQIGPTGETSQMGGWIMGAILVSAIAGTIYFGKAKDDPKTVK